VLGTDIPRRVPRREDKPFYKDKPEYAEDSLNRALEVGQITREDYQLIKLYVRELKAEQGISDILDRFLSFRLHYESQAGAHEFSLKS
jgi:hypothetical protein